jgi:hypothetical protein
MAKKRGKDQRVEISTATPSDGGTHRPRGGGGGESTRVAANREFIAYTVCSAVGINEDITGYLTPNSGHKTQPMLRDG